MRKGLMFIFSAALILYGCQNKEIEQNLSSPKTYTATTECYVLDTGTRTSLDADGNVRWKIGDQVSIFAGTTLNGQYQVTDASDGKTSAAFNPVSMPGFISGSDIDNNVAFYPYSADNELAKSGSAYVISTSLPSTQVYAESSFGNGAFPMSAVTGSTGDNNLKFKNILGGLKLQITGTAIISSIAVTGNDDEILCGTAEITVSETDSPSVNMTGTSKTVILDCGTGVQLNNTTATSFIIALPPNSMSKGFTVVITDTDGHQMEKITTKMQTISRSIILKMPVFEFEWSETEPETGYVDMGLSVMWATCNLGATKPEEYGDYYAWGATEPWYEDGYSLENPQNHWKSGKSAGYDWTNCPFCMDKNGFKFSKYIPSDESNYWGGIGSPDGKSILDYEDDAAYVLLGGNWRMPTEDEFDELLDNCETVLTSVNEINGVKFISKVNGNSIFLPIAGYRVNTNLAYYSQGGKQGFYWSSSLYTGVPFSAVILYYYSENNIRTDAHHDGRTCGLPIRPVYAEKISVSGITLDKMSTQLWTGSTTSIIATITPAKSFEKGVIWFSSNSSVASVDDNGIITALKEGETTITATTIDGGYSATCSVTVKAIPSGAVDMGLSVLWASCNLGASKPEGYGDYYSWGATEPLYKDGYATEDPQKHWKTEKSDGYSLKNSPFWVSGEDYDTAMYSKYVLSSSSSHWGGDGNPDNKGVLDLEDDAAHVKLGQNWRMPSREEIKELTDNCDVIWVTQNGVAGKKFTSLRTGKSIFLPASGGRHYTIMFQNGSYGEYWSSSIGSNTSSRACRLSISSTSAYTNDYPRYYGQPIRPVYDNLF